MTHTDCHSHILPGVDDGSRDTRESIAMLKLEAEQGITHVIATPHFYGQSDSPPRFLERRDRAEQQLRQAMAQYPELPTLSVGAEVLYFRGISDSEILSRLTIGGGSFLLLEMPPAPWPETVYQELEGIWRKWGITPIIAHIDRYIRPMKTYQIPRRLARLPVLVQANGDFFLERATAGMAMRMLRAGQIHLLGSDCHGIASRKPNLGQAISRIRQKLGSEALDRLRQYEASILNL